MDQRLDKQVSPYLTYSIKEWGELRADTPLTLSENELQQLQGLNTQVSMRDVQDAYLPISRLLSFYVASMQGLFDNVHGFFGKKNIQKVPYIIGLAGSVAVGKSTAARILRSLLARWPGHPKVDLVTTDGFLFPNAILEKEGLMQRKGFPESYDVAALLRFLNDIKAGKRHVTAPKYSHFSYDVIKDLTIEVDQPDILIVEGLNVLSVGPMPEDGKAIPFVSDFFDFSIYLDADTDIIEKWYVGRFMKLRETAFQDPESYFHRYSQVSHNEAIEIAKDIWSRINLANLKANVLPTRQRADLILSKGEDHAIQSVSLRRP